jgi:hypothetical protein
MKSRTFLLLLLCLLALGSVWLFTRDVPQVSSQLFPAVINRDCAPWDGSAFTVSITHPSGTIIFISIWQSPDMPFPVTFSFPDETGQVGTAYILPELGPFQPLTGEAWFQHVEQGMPVTGRFHVRSEAGVQWEGRFVAEWGNEIVYCG